MHQRVGMRLILLALVSCVVLTTSTPADAGTQKKAVKTQKAQKAKVAKAKAPAKVAKAKPKKDEPVVRDDDEEPAKTVKKETPKKTGQPVKQASDDEVPRNERSAKKSR